MLLSISQNTPFIKPFSFPLEVRKMNISILYCSCVQVELTDIHSNGEIWFLPSKWRNQIIMKLMTLQLRDPNRKGKKNCRKWKPPIAGYKILERAQFAFLFSVVVFLNLLNLHFKACCISSTSPLVRNLNLGLHLEYSSSWLVKTGHMVRRSLERTFQKEGLVKKILKLIIL